MRKSYKLTIITILLFISMNVLMFSENKCGNNITAKGETGNIDTEKLKDVVGTIYPTNNRNEKFIFITENSNEIYEIDQEKENNKKYVSEYVNYRIILNGNVTKRINTTNNENNTFTKYITIEKIEIIYNNVTVIGMVSLRGNPRKLIIKDEETGISYEFDNNQEDYEIYVEEYQAYKVKVIGKYYTKLFRNSKNEITEQRYLLVMSIEIIK